MPVGYANAFEISGVAGNLPVTPGGYASVGAWALEYTTERATRTNRIERVEGDMEL